MKENSEASNEIKGALNYINESLKYTSNERREHITIKQFLENDSSINFKFLQNAADTLLRDQTNKFAKQAISLEEGELAINAINVLSSDVKNMILGSFKDEKERVIDRNSLEAFYRVKDPNRKIDDKVRDDIEEAIRMSDDLEFTRAKTENDLIRAFTFEDLSQKQVENVINDWINLRVTDMKSKPEYKQLEDTEFKHIMINKLINNVISELGLYKLSDNARTYEELIPLNPKETYAYSNDVANKNNLNHIMQNALGYDNLVERLQQPEKSGELAQKNFAEQLLAEYYIDKRKDYRASKDLLKALDNEFKSTDYMDQTKRIGQDLNYQFAKRSKPNFMKEADGLAQYGNANYNGQKYQEMHMEDNSKLIKLGDDTNLAMFGDTQGVAESLYKYKKEAEQWPEILPKFDVRRDPKQWVEEKLNDVLKELFTAREHIEQSVDVSVADSTGRNRTIVLDRHLSRNELKTFDKKLAKHLNKENMVMRLLHELDKEFSELNQKRSESKFKRQIELNDKVQSDKKT